MKRRKRKSTDQRAAYFALTSTPVEYGRDLSGEYFGSIGQIDRLYADSLWGLFLDALALFVLLDIYLSKSVHIGELWELRFRIYEGKSCKRAETGYTQVEIDPSDIVRCPVCEGVNLNRSDSGQPGHRCDSNDL